MVAAVLQRHLLEVSTSDRREQDQDQFQVVMQDLRYCKPRWTRDSAAITKTGHREAINPLVRGKYSALH